MTEVRDYLNSKGLQLMEAGGDNVHLLCFFHGEQPGKRGRLYINVGDGEEAGLYMCHRCDARGNYRTIRQHFGDPPLSDGSKDEPDVKAALADALDYYERQHTDKTRDYLRTRRGLNDETIARFRLGYAPASQRTLWDYLSKERKHERDAILGTGLCKIDRRSGEIRDFFSRQIVIPYLVNGNPMQLRGKDPSGKYLTPPGQKARLFNAETAWKAKEVIICEGEFDAMVLEQLGYSAVGLPGSTSFQDAWIGYFGENEIIYTIFDPDAAGVKGQQRILEKLDDTKVRCLDLSPHVPMAIDPSDVDPTFLATVQGWDRASFDKLIADQWRKTSILVTPREAFEEWKSVQGVDGLKFGWEMLDKALAPGLLDGQVMVPLAKTNSGKSCHIDELALTPNGWRRHGDLAVGEQVIGSDGQATRILAIHPQGVRPLNRVTFSDGQSVVCDDDHLWTWSTRPTTKRRTTTTSDIKDALTRGLNVYLPVLSGPVQFAPQEPLPIDPYLFGVLLGDGSTSSGTAVVTTDDEIVRNLNLPADVEARLDTRVTPTVGAWRLVMTRRPGRAGSRFLDALRGLGLFGTLSKDRRIPSTVFTASVDERLAVVQGLLDTDASVSSNSIEYCSASQGLAEDVRDLVLSLGGSVGKGIRHRTTNYGTDAWRLTVRLPPELPAFRLTRKAAQWTPGNKQATRKIISVESVDAGEAVCISVDNVDNLYAVRGYALTHNSMLMLNMLQSASMVETQKDFKFLHISLEQTRGDWFERARRLWNFDNLDCPPSDVNSRTLDYWERRLRIIDKNRVTEDELHRALDDYHDQFGGKPDCVIVDYLGYFAQGYSGNARYERVSDAIMGLKAIAKDRRIRIIAPHQVSRNAEFGAEFQIDVARDSGAIEETADFAMALWSGDEGRGQEYDQRTGDRFLKIGKSRHGGKGRNIELQFGYLSLVMIPKEDGARALLARNEAPWDSDGTVSWQDAIHAHKTGLPPARFNAMPMGGP